MRDVRALVERQMPELKRAIPRGIDPNRFARVALTTFQQVPALLDCTPASLLGAMMQAAAWGLELDPVLGMAYLVPYREKAQLIIGYQGLIELARRSGEVRNVIPRAVHERDHFRYSFGLDETLDHTPCEDTDPGKLIAVYAIAYLHDGAIKKARGVPWKVFDVMTLAEVEQHRERSMAKNSGPWKTDYEAMAKKTVIRRLCKYLPKSTDLSRALYIDEQADRAEQDLSIGEVLDFGSVSGRVMAAGQAYDERSSLDKLAETIGEKPEPEPTLPPEPPPVSPNAPVAPPAPSAREMAAREQASRHEPARAHKAAAAIQTTDREPGQEG